VRGEIEAEQESLIQNGDGGLGKGEECIPLGNLCFDLP